MIEKKYQFEDIIESLKIVRKYGGWASMNYFAFPGMTDSVDEYEALREVIKYTDLSMIQWRNFNIDPDWYLGKVGLLSFAGLYFVRSFMKPDKNPLLKGL